ncbi:hypothetical protein DL93DRAFT_1882522 [Clavulina sp. PMI_390]|nr:hypothetical protein DL93DRAFT_1882522 [Clavulina sp. PMI_390]
MANVQHHHHRRKKRAGGLDHDDDERTDYAHGPLERSQPVEEDDSPFKSASAVDGPEAESSANAGDVIREVEDEHPKAPPSEVPIQDLLVPPNKRRDEKISAGYEIVSSPRARVYTIENDPSMSIISSGDESWEHVSQDGEADAGDDDDVAVITPDPDRKQYAEILKQPSPRPPLKSMTSTPDHYNAPLPPHRPSES